MEPLTDPAEAHGSTPAASQRFSHQQFSHQRFSHHGQGGELFAITLFNLVLKVLTLGLYHFWGKTRVRAYVWSHTHFAGEPFEYTGRGIELFIGYMLASVVLAPVVTGFQFLPLLIGNIPLVMGALMLGAYLVLFFLMGFATYASRRYLLSHTRWRSIRFGLSGSALRYGLRMLNYSFLTAITLGFYFPFLRNNLTGMLLGDMWFGDRRVHYDGRGKDLLRRFLGLWVIYLLLIATLAAGWVGLGIIAMTPLDIDGIPLHPLLWLGTGLLAALGATAGWMWYRVGEYRYFVAHTRIDEVRFRLTASTARLIWLSLSNLILMGATLGMAYAWVVVRTARLIARHMTLTGTLELDTIAQHPEGIPALGEGLAETFDLGSGI